MSHRYSIAEARSSLPSIVDQAEAGVEIELTRRGKPVAAVVALRVLERLRADRPRFRTAYLDFLKRYSLDEVGFDNDFFAPIREKSAGRTVSL
ncbi:MAG: type II toxin-antitoxin system prevent-host-death family antitoxin [Acidobacteria bacterium]|nr:type II toxin-antitoxin system prevent-host-death family antitoxin [Acidobacteriota bacterium]